MRPYPWISRITTMMAGILAAAITVIVPTAYFVVSSLYLGGDLDAEAEICSAAVSNVIMDNPSMWRFEQVRLSELLDRRPQDRTLELRRVVALDGAIIAQSSDQLLKPTITRTRQIFDAGTAVARVEVSRSLVPVLWKTVIVAVAAFVAGGLIFIILRIVPLKAVRRAYRSLEDSEQRYRSLFESMREGVLLYRMTYDEHAAPTSITVVDVNPSCQRLFGLDRDELVGTGGPDFFGSVLAEQFPHIIHAAATGEAFFFDFVEPLRKQSLHVAVFFPEPGLFAFLIEDVTQRKAHEEQIRKLAYYDNLTGLPNRALLLDRLEQALAEARREGTRLGLLFLDLDRFKVINDTLGHGQGDNLLIQVSNRLRRKLRSSDTLARIGGDEFIVLVPHDGEEVNLTHLAQHLLDSITAVYTLGGREIYASASIGIAVFPEDGQTGDSLLRCADMAMYAAKDRGGKGFHFFSAEMNFKAHARMELETNLRHALEHNHFTLEFQPVINASNGRFVGAEALLRWNDPEKGLVMPDMFVSVAEESGIIVPLGEWVLRTACRKMQQWRRAGLPPFRLSVNVSGRQFRQAGFADTVCAIVRETGIDARFLALEMTETCLMVDAAATASALMRLKELEVSIVVDDFGTGYSSLGYLKKFPIDVIKIDRSFIKDLTTDTNDRAIVEAIIAMAARLKLLVVAEGVETREQLDFLKGQGCNEIQGFHFHGPLSEERLMALLRGVEQTFPICADLSGDGSVVSSVAGCC